MLNINIENVNPFAVKLTYAQRCFIYAAHHYKQVPIAALARSFGVNDQTVGKLVRAGNSRHYMNVFQEGKRLGIERMWEQYATPGLIKQIEDVEQARAAKMLIIHDHYTESGPGFYYIKDSKGYKVAVDVQPCEGGFHFKPKKAEFWRVSQEREGPFESIAELLRYLAEYPFEVE